jgi:hypothetical protein
MQPILVTYSAEKIPLSSSCLSENIAYGIRVSNDTIDSLGRLNQYC